jgi:RHS repeat-associated protein
MTLRRHTVIGFLKAILFSVGFLFFSPLSAQIPQITNLNVPPMPGSGHDYIHLLSETVDPSKGGLSIEINVSMPKGRGLSLPFGFRYSTGGLYVPTIDGALFGIQTNTVAFASGGWSYAIPVLNWGEPILINNDQGGCIVQEGYSFRDSNGVSHPFGVATTNGSPGCAFAGINDVQKDHNEFYQIDLGLTGPPLAGILVAGRDGTTYTMGFQQNTNAFPAMIEDRNGNIIRLTSMQNGGFTFQDTVGRTVLSASGFASGVVTISVAGATNPYSVNWQTVTGHILGSTVSFATIMSITLPNGNLYHFAYDPVTGFLNQITYPNGATVKYTWGTNPNSDMFNSFDPIGGCNVHGTYSWPAITHREVSFDGVHTALTQDFSYSTVLNHSTSGGCFDNSNIIWLSKSTTVTTNDLVSGTTSQVIYNYLPNDADPSLVIPISSRYSGTSGAVPVEDTVIYKDGSNNTLRTVKKTWYDARLINSEQTTLANGLTTSTVYQRAQYSTSFNPQLTEVDDNGFGSGSVGSQLRKTTVAYETFGVTPAFPGAPSILDMPCQVITYDGGGNRVAETDYFFDGGNVVCGAPGSPSVAPVSNLPAGTHDETNYGSGSLASRANATSITNKCFIPSTGQTCTDATTTYAFDNTGQIISATDPLGNVTQFGFADNFSDTAPSTNTNAYLTKITRPRTNGVDHISNFQYAYSDGQLTLALDENSQPVTYLYNDPLRRMTETDFPDTGSTKITYNDSGASPSIVTTRAITGTANLISTSVMDGLGHIVQTQLNSDPDGVDFVDIIYDGYGRSRTASNAHRAGTAPTDGTTTTQFDALGRPTQVTKPDGGTVTIQHDVSTTINGTCARETDETGRQRATCTDALDHLVEVDEPNAAAVGTSSTASVTISGRLGEAIITGGTPPTAAAGSPLTSVVTSDGSSHTFYFDTNRHICQVYWSSTSGWVNEDLTAITGNTPAGSGSGLTSTLMLNGSIQVFYLGSNQDVYDLFWNASGGWGNQDLTAITGNTQAAPGSALTSTTLIDGSPSGTVHAFYFGPNQDVYHLYLSAAAGWANQDLTAITGHTLAASGSDIAAVLLNNNSLNVFYLDTNQHINDIYWSSAANWGNADITAITGNHSAAVASKLTGLAPATGSILSQVFYEGPDQHIYNTYYSSSLPGWQTQDLTRATRNVLAISGSALTSTIVSGNWYVGYVGASNQYVYTLYFNGSIWDNADLDSAAGSTVAAGSGGGLSAVGNADNLYMHFFYLSSLQHIYDLYYNVSLPGWQSADLTASSKSTQLDSGIVSLNVDGFIATACFGASTNPSCSGQPQNFTASDVAASLAAAINVSSSPATATATGSTITMTWKTPGSFTAPVSALATTHDNSILFPNPSFSSAGTTFAGGQGPALDSTSYVTLYQYDALGNLTCVEQHGNSPAGPHADGTAGTGCNAASTSDANSTWRVRRFTYDSLSRLLTATIPESGTISYRYDADDNLLQKTSPAPNQMGSATQTISYCHDALNRVTGKAYSLQTCDANGLLPPGTAVASYFYDQTSYNGLTLSNGVGRRTGMSDQAGLEAWSYDTMGRPAADKRTIGSVSKTTSYLYNLLGSPTSVTYPSGTTIAYNYSNAGRPISVIDTTHSITYTPAATYSPHGALASMTNGTNLSSTFLYNNRLQPCRVFVTTGASGPSNCTDTGTIGSILDFEYGFNWAIGDNGNVISVTNLRDTTRNQSFAYDSLNRLLTAQTNATTGTKCFGEAFGYDAWGNLLTIGGVDGYTACTQENLGIAANVKNQISTNAYDAAGNLTTGGYTYDAENHLLTAGGVTYTYDGDGKRVQKSSGKSYWYGMAADALDETDSSGATNNSTFNEYVFFNGTRVARRDSSNSVFYYFADSIGTSRVMVQAGQTLPCYDADFYPYGGERTPINNTCAQNYKFTGKERDPESGLDNFAARHYASSLGRFMQTDPIWVKGDRMVDPQRLNLYAYVRNNPLRLTDPTGMDVILRTCNSSSGPTTVTQCFSSVLNGLKKADRSHVHLVQGNGKNGFKKGQYGITVDADYKGSAGNFATLQKLANDHSATAAIDVLKPTDSFNVRVSLSYNAKTGFGPLTTMRMSPGDPRHPGRSGGMAFMGYTLFPPGSNGPQMFSGDDMTDVLVNTLSDDLSATIHHELRHVLLGDFGRMGQNAEHGIPEVDKQTKDAEKEAKQNEKEK